MNANGSAQTRVTTNAADDAQPDWSPDGKLAFTSIGSTINTTVNTLFGSTAITESKRAIWQLTDIVRIYDGGADGVASTTGDNQLFQAGGGVHSVSRPHTCSS
jgi:Tol biopolymer transport system component